MILGQPEQQMHQGRQHMHGGVHRHGAGKLQLHPEGDQHDPQPWDEGG